MPPNLINERGSASAKKPDAPSLIRDPSSGATLTALATAAMPSPTVVILATIARPRSVVIAVSRVLIPVTFYMPICAPVH
jgi:hypothetical protein